MYSVKTEVTIMQRIPYNDHFSLEKYGEIFFFPSRSQNVNKGTERATRYVIMGHDVLKLEKKIFSLGVLLRCMASKLVLHSRMNIPGHFT